MKAYLQESVVGIKGIEELKDLMIGKTTMFSGHSGVGKSTLVNALEPSLHLKTKTISEQSMQGQHTTTFAEMYDLSFDAKKEFLVYVKPGAFKGFYDLQKIDMDILAEIYKSLEKSIDLRIE